MMPFVRSPFLSCLAVACMALGAPLAAHADPMSLSSSKINVDFDPSSFFFMKETNSFGGITQVEIPPLDVSYSLAGDDTVLLNFNGAMSVYATSYFTFSPESLGGSFLAQFGVTPQAGFQITGYTVTLAGSYSIETPGSVSVGSTTAGPFTAITGGDTFSVSGYVGGAFAPALQGGITATGEIATIQVLEGYEQVLDHYETVLDYCETEEPFTCHYREEPVYISVPYYREETDLGEATVNLQTISLQAHVVPVPEPAAIAMVIGVLPCVGWWAARRRRGAA